MIAMRLDFFIANGTHLSRKEAKKAIAAGEVQIDGKVCRKAGQIVDGSETISLGDQTVTLKSYRYLMLHKPLGTLSATRDAAQPTVMDLLPAAKRVGLHCVGRLDKDTSGLLLLTDDGDWSHQITSPRYQCPKRYLAELADPINPEDLEPLTNGIMLRNDPALARAQAVQWIDSQTVEISVTEGRYHLIRRMIAAIGNRVTALHRVSIGGLQLDQRLSEGEWRPLAPEEVALLADTRKP